MQAVELDVLEHDVDRLAVHVQAVLRHLGALLAQHGVGLRRAVAGDHLERRLRAQADAQVGDQVQQARLDRVHVAGAEVAQHMVHRLQGAWHVLAVLPIDGVQGLVGVQVLQGDGARLEGDAFQDGTDGRVLQRHGRGPVRVVVGGRQQSV